MLHATASPLSSTYDLVALDLDGVVYVGPEAVPGAPEHLARAREAGTKVAFVTNNAARPPSAVAEHLRELGIAADPQDVVSSAQAAARLLADQVPTGSPVFLMGGPGLEIALTEAGLVPVADAKDDPVAVAQGYGPDMPWSRVVAGAILVGQGLPWVVSNTDMTIPTGTGIGPGHGTLVRLVAEHTGREPQVAGKPEPPLLEETLRRVGGERPLFVGDRLDTDIAGAQRVGWDSLLVLTGVTGLAELVAAEPDERPTYLSPDLAALGEVQPAPDVTGNDVELGGWRARTTDDNLLEVEGDGSPADWWRVVAQASWQHRDETGAVVDTSAVTAPGPDSRVA